MHETQNPNIAVMLVYRVTVVDRLTLREDRILGGLHRKMLALHEEKNQVRLLGKVCAIVVGHFRRPHNIPDSPSVKPFYFRGIDEPILQNGIKLPRNVILSGRREDKFSGWILAKQLKRLYQSQVHR
jgi:hypothetical protein